MNENLTPKEKFGERCKAARAGISREKASEELERALRKRYPDEDVSFSAEKLKRIETAKVKIINTEDVDIMAEVFREPELRNEYCANVCSMGQRYVEEVKNPGLEKLALQLIAVLNAVDKEKDKFIEIMADGHVSPDEQESFYELNEYLNKISGISDGINLWLEKQQSKSR